MLIIGIILVLLALTLSYGEPSKEDMVVAIIVFIVGIAFLIINTAEQYGIHA